MALVTVEVRENQCTVTVLAMGTEKRISFRDCWYFPHDLGHQTGFICILSSLFNPCVSLQP